MFIGISLPAVKSNNFPAFNIMKNISFDNFLGKSNHSLLYDAIAIIWIFDDSKSPAMQYKRICISKICNPSNGLRADKMPFLLEFTIVCIPKNSKYYD